MMSCITWLAQFTNFSISIWRRNSSEVMIAAFVYFFGANR